MKRFAVYPDISDSYVVVDTQSERVIALYPQRRPAERAAARLNNEPVNMTARVFKSAADVADAMVDYQRHAGPAGQ